MNKVTMQDIADALGISRVTVWKVFNNYTNVSASVREKVLLKAKELGYTGGRAAGARDSVGYCPSLCRRYPRSTRSRMRSRISRFCMAAMMP